MSSTFITADEHYGHEKIIEYCHRPFASIQEMNEAMIERHNKKVPDNPGFLTIHVGDLFWHTLGLDEAARILRRLHGRHAFIFGNHDELLEKYRHVFDCPGSLFNWIEGKNKASGVHILHFNKHKITLCHYAMRVWDGSNKGSWMLYGHSHGELPVIGKSFDIGVDGHNFEPWSLEEIETEMEKHSTTNTDQRGKPL